MFDDPEALLAFYDFLAEHWKHLRTTDPIESFGSLSLHRGAAGSRSDKRP
jgi:transposase-like protein